MMFLKNGNAKRVLVGAWMFGGMSVSTASAAAAASEREERIVASIVIHRHGARKPVYRLPSSCNTQPYYPELTAPPPGSQAPPLLLNRNNLKSQAAKAGDNGLLTTVGWAQGEALGRRLRARYGDIKNAPGYLKVISTDVSRTVLTVQAVLEGLGVTTPVAVAVDEAPSPMHINSMSACSALTEMMGAGFASQQNSTTFSKRTKIVHESFRKLLEEDESHKNRLGFVPIHDDCVARLFHSVPGSPHVDLSLCEMASEQSAMLVFSAVASNGDLNKSRLAAGMLASRVAAQLRNFAASASDDSTTVRLMLLSAHDTTVINCLSMLDHCGVTSPAMEVFGHHWPPHCSSICFELLDPNPPGGNALPLHVRVVYQFADEVVDLRPLDDFLKDLDAVATTPEERVELCGPQSRSTFSYASGLSAGQPVMDVVQK